jgi:hypothetical protein
MSDLGPEASALLARARGKEGPTPADQERVLASVALAVGVASSSLLAAPAAAAGGAPAASLFGVFKGAATKVLLSCLAGAALGTAVAVPIALSTPEPAPSAVASVAPPPIVARAASSAALAAHPPPQGAPAAMAPSARGPAPSAAVSSAPRTLTAEAELLLAAQHELGAGRAERALALLDEHAQRHPRGVLAQESAAARVLALCATGRVAAARAEAEAFVREAPGSPLVPRVRRSCAFAAPKSSAAFAPLTEPARPGQ